MKKSIVLLIVLFCAAYPVFSQQFEIKEYFKPDSNGLINGAYLLKCNDTLLTKGYFQDGKKFGRWTFYNYRGEKTIDGFFLNDSLHGQWTYYKNNKKMSLINYNQGTLHGKVASYYPNGNLRISSTYNNGMIDDTLSAYDENGVKKIEVVFDHNRPVSILKSEISNNIYFGFAGDLINGNGKYVFLAQYMGAMIKLEERNYVSGKLHGKYESKEYNVRSVAGYIESDLLTGTWTFLDENGTLVEEKEYQMSDSIPFSFISEYEQTANKQILLNKPLYFAEEYPKFLGDSIFRKSRSYYPVENIRKISPNETMLRQYLKTQMAHFDIPTKGTFRIRFIIGKLGEINSVQIIQNNLSEEIESEIISIISNLPFFEPAYENGFPVNFIHFENFSY